MKWWGKYKNSLTLEKRFILVIGSIVVIVLSVFGTSAYSFLRVRYEALLYKSMASSADQNTKNLQESLKSAVQLTDIIRTDTVIQSHLNLIYHESNYRTERSYEQIYWALENKYQAYKKDYMVYAAIVNPRFISYTYGHQYTKLDTAEIPKMIAYAKKEKGYPVWYSEKDGDGYLYLVREIRKNDIRDLKNLGTLIIAIDLNLLSEHIQHENHMAETVDWMLYDQENMVYRSETLGDVKEMQDIRLSEAPYGIMKIGGKRYFYLKGQLEEPAWDYYQVLSYDEVFQTQQYLLYLFLLLLGISIVVSIIAVHVSIRESMKDINHLHQKIRLFSGNNAHTVLNTYDYSNRKDEIAMLHQNFDRMAQKIETLIKQDYELNMALKNMQLKTLKAQINPHFLYNTLDSINWRAKVSGNEEISKMVEALAALLRTSLNTKQSLVPLSEELRLVQYYLTIQKIRYEEELIYRFEVDPSLKDCLLPPLSIQPLVENAIKYGLEQMLNSCHILITAERLDETTFRVAIKNDGSFFEEGLLKNLQKKEGQSQIHGLGIGLLNINQRIQLIFGLEYGLQLYNEENFAVAAITIPCSQVQGRLNTEC